jgi:hypothetical protein
MSFNKRPRSIADDTFKILEEEFQMLTRHFDLDDWRDCRNKKYWESDEIKDKTAKLMYKIKLIRYYNQHGKPEE